MEQSREFELTKLWNDTPGHDTWADLRLFSRSLGLRKHSYPHPAGHEVTLSVSARALEVFHVIYLTLLSLPCRVRPHGTTSYME